MQDKSLMFGYGIFSNIGIRKSVQEVSEQCRGSFGGAMVVSNNGDVIDAFPLGKTGMLVVDLHTLLQKSP